MHGINYFAVTQSELIICILNCYNLSYFADVSLVILCYLWPDEENAMFSKTLALFLLICVLFMLNESCPSCVVIFHQIITVKVHLFGSILKRNSLPIFAFVRCSLSAELLPEFAI